MDYEELLETPEEIHKISEVETVAKNTRQEEEKVVPEVSISLTQEQVAKIIGKDHKVMTYKDAKEYQTLLELFGNHDKVLILIEFQTPNRGH